MQNKRNIWQAITSQGRVIVVLVTCVIIGSSITYALYNYTRVLMEEGLRERLLAIVSTAALQFSADDVKAVRDEKDAVTPAYRRLVTELAAIQAENSNITYAYIMRKTKDPNTFSFVADAQGLIPPEEWDFNGDGVVSDDEVVPQPGEPFDVSSYPALRDKAYLFPVIADSLEMDQWSTQLSAYAPIFDNQNKQPVAIFGVDVEVSDYLHRTQETLLPFVLFIIALILLLMLLTLLLVRFYRERVNAVQELDRQKDELISIVSHQLATPVTSVKWYIEMMLDGDAGKLTEEQEKQLKTMQGVTADLVDLVGMILDVSRIQLGRMKVDRAPLDLGEFFVDILAVIEPKAQVKKQQFIKSLPKELPTAMLDKRLMRMTLENLLSNAVKYTPEGGKVELKVEAKDKMLRYSVKDTGCGIPKEEHDKIFGKLFRATNVRNTEGNGLGLFAAKGAVEAQAGKVWFESTAGKGTTFYVEIPLSGS